jgi:hypothetical protein
MNRAWLLLLLIVTVSSGCSVTTTNLRLDQLNTPGLSEQETAAETTALRARAEGLWGRLEAAKLTTHLTKARVAEYFETDKDRSDFTAIYASLFREKKFEREYVNNFQVGKIVIEQNGVLAHVEVTIWGKIYFIWRAKIHDVQTWKRIGGQWMMKPEAY